jgi:hypothetical protein
MAATRFVSSHIKTSSSSDTVTLDESAQSAEKKTKKKGKKSSVGYLYLSRGLLHVVESLDHFPLTTQRFYFAQR